jgi:hypothetical protein
MRSSISDSCGCSVVSWFALARTASVSSSADLLDLVAPELHPQRMLLGGREHIQDAAAHSELAALGDQVDAGVGDVDEALHDLVEVVRPAGGKFDRFEVAEALELRLEHRAHRSDHHARRPVGARVREPAQHREAPAHGVRPRGEALVRQRLPGRVDDDAFCLHETAEGLGEVVGLAAGRGDREHRRGRGDRGDHQRPQGRRRGDVDRIDVLLSGEFVGAGECAIGQGGGQQAGELHGSFFRFTARVLAPTGA